MHVSKVSQNSFPYTQIFYKEQRVYLHRLIANADIGDYVDHINHNTLDNRKENLRIVSFSENMLNRKGAQVNNSSRYRGVHKNGKGKWVARVIIQGVTYRLGTFECSEEANEVVTQFRRQYVPHSEMDKLE